MNDSPNALYINATENTATHCGLVELGHQSDGTLNRTCASNQFKRRGKALYYEMIIRLIPRARNLMGILDGLLHQLQLRKLSDDVTSVSMTYWDGSEHVKNRELLIPNIQQNSDGIKIEFSIQQYEETTELVDLAVKFHWKSTKLTYNLEIAEVTVNNLSTGKQIMHVMQYPPTSIGNEVFHISMNFNTICEKTGQRCCYIGYHTQDISECDPEFNVFCGSDCTETALDPTDLGTCDCKPNEYDKGDV